MQIREATPKDAKRIREISLELNRDRNAQGLPSFIEYPIPNEKEFERRIKNNPFFYIAENERQLIGFSAAYTDEQLEKCDFSNDQIAQHILTKPRPFIYWDQLAIANQFQDKGTGIRLGNLFIGNTTSTDHKSVWGAVIHSPIKHELSVRIMAHFGMRPEEEIGVYNGLVFGIYKRNLRSED